VDPFRFVDRKYELGICGTTQTATGLKETGSGLSGVVRKSVELGIYSTTQTATGPKGTGSGVSSVVWKSVDGN
jgi:hypothetical protein